MEHLMARASGRRATFFDPINNTSVLEEESPRRSLMGKESHIQTLQEMAKLLDDQQDYGLEDEDHAYEKQRALQRISQRRISLRASTRDCKRSHSPRSYPTESSEPDDDSHASWDSEEPSEEHEKVIVQFSTAVYYCEVRCIPKPVELRASTDGQHTEVPV
jgi:hypothetical protein